MRLFAALARWVSDGRATGPHFSKKHARHSSVGERRLCCVEPLEPRQLLAGDIHLGSVYFEEATGDDSEADVMEVTFAGGAAGTQLAQLTIDGDKKGNGRFEGDPFFDTESGGLGAFQHVGLTIVSHEGFEVSGVTLVDGGSQLVFDFVGFDAGEKLLFSVDVDEISFIEDNGTVSATSIVEGGEFERSRLSALFIAPHFENTQIDTVYWDTFDDNFAAAASTAGSTLDLPSDAYRGDDDLSDRTAGAVGLGTQHPLPIAISGTVFVDTDLDNQQDAGETGIAGVQLSLWMFDAQSGELMDTGKQAATDGLGDYEFNSSTDPILPGRYEVRETQPDGYFSVGAAPGTVDGLSVGSALDADTLGEIDLVGGQHSIDNNFAEALPADLGGFVYHDVNNDGLRDTGEQGIADVEIQIVPVNTLNGSTDVIVVSTDDTGLWMATGLAPGEYRVLEPVQPTGYLDGLDRAGTVLGVPVGTAVNPGDGIEAIVIGSGAVGIDYNFGELLPSRISGQVHASTDGNCVVDEDDVPLSGIVIDLLDADGLLLQTTVTDNEGRYVVDNLAPGEYQVVEHQPADYFDGDEHVGSAGGLVVDDDHVANIVLTSGTDAVGYDFCEHVGVNYSGWVYHDESNDGVFDASESGIGGVTLMLLDGDGKETGLTVTSSQDADNRGSYQFTNLAAGTYGVAQIQPDGYLDGLDTAGDHGGTAENSGDRILGAVLTFDSDAANYNFGELLPSRISGQVHASIDGDCVLDPHDIPLADVQIDLFDTDSLLLQTTLTDSEGRYVFDHLAPGEYQIVEHQPVDYFDGDEHVGGAGGLVVDDDHVAKIVVTSGTDATGYNFCEHVGASFSGWVYHDEDNDGTFDESETAIGGVTLMLLDADGNATGATTTTSTDAANLGYYEFTDLLQGTYGVAEVQPDGYLDGIDTPGDRGGTAQSDGDRIIGLFLAWGQSATEYNFGELLPGSIRGAVHVSADGDCPVDGPPIDEHPTPIAGVVIELYDAKNLLIATTVTDDAGRYEFIGLAPGVYTVRERQPDGFFDGHAHVGSDTGVVLGENHIGKIQVGSDKHLVNNDFCETLPASISGYVFQDGSTIVTSDGSSPDNLAELRDGKRTDDDRPLSGVVLELRNGQQGTAILSGAALKGTYGDGPIRAVTDAVGFYEFVGLPPGTYAVYQIQPERLFDGIDTPGTAGGLAVNPHEPVDSGVISQLLVDPNNDAILAIELIAGTVSRENNFSEIDVVAAPKPPVFFPPITEPAARAAVLPVTFVHPLPPAPEPTRLVVPDPTPPVYGSSTAMAFTWHLSVIDAGRPRSIDSHHFLVRLTGSSVQHIAWQSGQTDQTSWTLLQIDQLSGESRRTALFGNSQGVPVAGDFNGDGRADLGLFLNGEWFIDINGNGRWDKDDLWAKLGEEGDTPVTGDWDGDGKTDIGIFGPAWAGDARAIEHEAGLPDRHNQLMGRWKNIPPQQREAAHGSRVMKLTSQGTVRTDVIDHVFRYGEAGDAPVAGDWNGDGIDTIGVFRHGMWHLDTNGDGRLTAEDQHVEFGQAGDVPVVGDWSSDGIDALGVYQNGTWILDTNGDRHLDAHDRVFSDGGIGLPVVGDWDGDGREEPGLFHGGPQATARQPSE